MSFGSVSRSRSPEPGAFVLLRYKSSCAVLAPSLVGKWPGRPSGLHTRTTAILSSRTPSSVVEPTDISRQKFLGRCLTRIIHKPAPALACSLIRKGTCLRRTYHTGTRLHRQIPLRIKLLRDHRGGLRISWVGSVASSRVGPQPIPAPHLSQFETLASFRTKSPNSFDFFFASR